jgi:hypothetical protein
MKETIYLTVSKQGIQAMRKSYTGEKKGEIVVKLLVEVDDKVFGAPPTVEKFVHVSDWKTGVDVDDVKFDQHFITEEEAEIIRQKRLLKMKEILESQGFTIEKTEE